MHVSRPLMISLLLLVVPTGAVCGQDRAREEYLKGNAAFADFAYETALIHYDRSLALDSSNADAYLGRGRTYWILLQYRRAVPDLTRAIELDPGLSWAYYFRGISLLNLRDFEAGIADLTKVTGPNVLPPDFRVRALHFRGIGYMNLERYGQAIADISTCIDLDPEQSLYFFERASLYEAVGRTKAAISDYETFLAAHPPSTARAEAVRQKLIALREGSR